MGVGLGSIYILLLPREGCLVIVIFPGQLLLHVYIHVYFFKELAFIILLGRYPAGTWRVYNVASTLMQHDVASTLIRCCQRCLPAGYILNITGCLMSLFVQSFQPKSARQYTVEDYEYLKEELRRKQIAYKSMLTRPMTCFWYMFSINIYCQCFPLVKQSKKMQKHISKLWMEIPRKATIMTYSLPEVSLKGMISV